MPQHATASATDERIDLVERLGRGTIPGSARRAGGLTLWAERSGASTRLAIAATDPARLDPFEGERGEAAGVRVLRGPASPANAAALRAAIPELAPAPLGTATSAGFGDRLGLATPGHVDALRASGAAAAGIAPVFAQQSMRENARTGRTPQGVLDDATHGAFLAGWHGPVGADADHVKREEEIDTCLDAGYSFFTFDPGEHVAAEADALEGGALASAFEGLGAWEALETDAADTRRRLEGRRIDLGTRELRLDAEPLARAAVKYGPALAHVVRLARHLRLRADEARAEIEVSVDETETPTGLVEHAYMALELRRLGVDWVSLAPRFVGAFEKGVDYLGDLALLAGDLEGHALVARALGPYKLSLHSGSDKFAVYPVAAEATNGAVHLKTAGTSYLEGLRVAAAHEPELLREIVATGLERFEEDVRSYHVSGRPEGVPDPEALRGGALAALLEQRDARQVLHVTFGSALSRHGERLLALLRAHEGDYRDALRRHFERHLAPFVATRAVRS